MDWESIGGELDASGCAVMTGVLSAAECASVATSFDDDAPFRSHVVMARHGFGRGEYASDFTGGEFVLTEQRPRMQSRAEVVPLQRGDAVIFPVHHRPVRGTRVYRVNLRHGVSRVRSGHRRQSSSPASTACRSSTRPSKRCARSRR